MMMSSLLSEATSLIIFCPECNSQSSSLPRSATATQSATTTYDKQDFTHFTISESDACLKITKHDTGQVCGGTNQAE